MIEKVDWLAAYTRSRHEKSVALHLESLQIPHFLPLYSKMSRWKDRKVQLQFPLFPNYVFVRIPPSARVPVLRLPGVISLVSSRGRPLPMPETEIERLRDAIGKGSVVEPYRYLEIGRRVRVMSGPFEGYEGILEQKKNAHKVIVAIPYIMRAFAITVQPDEVEPLLGGVA